MDINLRIFQENECLNLPARLQYTMILCKGAPEEGHDLRSGAIRVGAECGVGGSLGDVLLDRP